MIKPFAIQRLARTPRFQTRATFVAMVILASIASGTEKIPLNTDVVYVGERYLYRAQLPGIWRYGLSDAEDGIQVGLTTSDDDDPVVGQVITVTEKIAFDSWAQDHTAEWAADAYRRWELENMKSEGVETGMYRLHDTKMSEVTLDGKRFFTFTYKQTIKNPFMRGVVNHAFLFLHFPDDYDVSRRFFWIHYLEARDKLDGGRPSMGFVQKVVSGFSLDHDDRPARTTITWADTARKHVHLSVPNRKRTYYFDNDSQRQCYSFQMDGIWYPASIPGIFIAGNQYDHGGITLLSKDELEEFEGETLVDRAASCEMANLEASGEAEVQETNVAPLECVFPGTVKWTADYSVRLFGQKAMGKNAWYISEVKPGWAAVVEAYIGTNTGDDDMARDLFGSLVLSDDADCFHEEIRQLVK